MISRFLLFGNAIVLACSIIDSPKSNQPPLNGREGEEGDTRSGRRMHTTEWYSSIQ